VNDNTGVGPKPGISICISDGNLQVSDPLDALKDCIVFVAFPNSRSANLPLAVSLARSFSICGEQDIGGRILHWAGVTSQLYDLKRGAELIRIAGSWKGAMVRVKGASVENPFNAFLTISCYLQARQCTSQAAHCHKVIDDPFHRYFNASTLKVCYPDENISTARGALMVTEHVKQYAFPCKQMLRFSMFHTQFRFAPHHQANP